MQHVKCKYLRLRVVHQVTSKTPVNFDLVHGAAFGAPAMRRLERMNIYAAAAPAGPQHTDNHFEGRGVWTECSIPAKFMGLLERHEWITTCLNSYERVTWLATTLI